MLSSTRRIAALLVIGLTMGAAGACGGGNDSAGGPGQRQVAYLATSLVQSYSVAIAAGYKNGVAEVPGIAQRVVAPPVDADSIKQLAIFKDLTKTAPGGIAFSAGAPEQWVEALSEAHADGIPLIAVDIPPPAGSGVTLYVGNDNQAMGEALADLVIDQLPANASGTVVLGNPRPGLPVLDLRAVSVRKQFAKRLPNVKVKGPFDTTVRPESMLKAWTQLARSNPKALGMLSVGADGAMLAKARQATKSTWKAAAFDVDPMALAAVKRGELQLVSPEHFLKGAITGRLLAEFAAGETTLPEGWISTHALAVTKENVDSIIAREASDTTRMAYFKPILDQEFSNGGPKALPLSQLR